MTHIDINDLETRFYVFKVGDKGKGIEARYEKDTDVLIFPRAAFDYVFDLVKDGLEQQPCEDAVSRESVDRILMDLATKNAYDMPSFWFNNNRDYKVIPTQWHKGYQQAISDFNKRLKALPSVTRQIPKWINSQNGTYECSRCGEKHSRSNYCPRCGADMRGAE